MIRELLSRVKRVLVGSPSIEEARWEWEQLNRPNRCWCGLPKCAWSERYCPGHASLEEWDAWTQHPDYLGWCARVGRDPNMPHPKQQRQMLETPRCELCGRSPEEHGRYVEKGEVKTFCKSPLPSDKFQCEP